MSAATIKYKVKTSTMTSEGTGLLWDLWPHLLVSIGGPAEREKALAAAKETHENLLEWEAEQDAKAVKVRAS